MNYTKVEKKAMLQFLVVGMNAKNIKLTNDELRKLLEKLEINSMSEVQDLERMSMFSYSELFTILQFNNSMEKLITFRRIQSEIGL